MGARSSSARLSRIGSLIGWLILSGAPLSALAQDGAPTSPARATAPVNGKSESPPPGYTALVARGVTAFEAGRYLEARELMFRAHQLYPNARTSRGMGLAAFEAERYALAVIDFERALADSRQPMSDTQREEVERLQAEANASVARFRLTGQLPGAVILVDAEPPVWDAGGFLLVDAGEHALSLQPAGSEPRTLTLLAEGGHWSELDLTTLRIAARQPPPNPWHASAATPLASEPEPEPAPPAATAEAPPAPRRTPIAPEPTWRREPVAPVATTEPDADRSDDLTTVLVASAFGGAAIAAGVSIWQWRLRESEVSSWNSGACLSGGRQRRENCAAHERAYGNAERWSWVAAGAAVALSAGGAALLWLDGEEGAERDAAARCVPGALALSCRVSF